MQRKGRKAEIRLSVNQNGIECQTVREFGNDGRIERMGCGEMYTLIVNRVDVLGTVATALQLVPIKIELLEAMTWRRHNLDTRSKRERIPRPIEVFCVRAVPSYP